MRPKPGICPLTLSAGFQGHEFYEIINIFLRSWKSYFMRKEYLGFLIFLYFKEEEDSLRHQTLPRLHRIFLIKGQIRLHQTQNRNTEAILKIERGKNE